MITTLMPAARTAAVLLVMLMAAPSTPTGQVREAVLDLPRWLVGCWSGGSGDLRFRERWTAADAQTLLGVGYTVAQDGLRSFEYLRVVIEEGRAIYIAQPSGAPATKFTASALTAREVTFENLTHDFPKRVSYRRVDATHLLAWIDGGTSASRRIEFPMQRESCEP